MISNYHKKSKIFLRLGVIHQFQEGKYPFKGSTPLKGFADLSNNDWGLTTVKFFSDTPIKRKIQLDS